MTYLLIVERHLDGDFLGLLGGYFAGGFRDYVALDVVPLELVTDVLVGSVPEFEGGRETVGVPGVLEDQLFSVELESQGHCAALLLRFRLVYSAWIGQISFSLFS